jgi:hypothetical protein
MWPNFEWDNCLNRSVSGNKGKLYFIVLCGGKIVFTLFVIFSGFSATVDQRSRVDTKEEKDL